MQSITSKQISLRLVEAWNTATAEKGLKVRLFEKFGIDKRNFSWTLRDMDRHNLDVSWIVSVVIKFKVPADWILTGRGDLMEKDGFVFLSRFL